MPVSVGMPYRFRHCRSGHRKNAAHRVALQHGVDRRAVETIVAPRLFEQLKGRQAQVVGVYIQAIPVDHVALALDRRLGAYEVPDGWAIFAAGNRQGDRGVTYTMPAPLANRFSHYEVDINLDDWVAWAYANHIDERLIAFLRFRPELLFEFDPAHNPVAFPSPRSWEFSHRALQKFGDLPALLTGALQACVGPAAGVELSAFVENLDKLPDIDAIVRGDVVKVPRETDLQYAIAAALVGRAIRERQESDAQLIFGNIIEFAGSFPQREMGVMLVSDMHRAIGRLQRDLPVDEENAPKLPPPAGAKAAAGLWHRAISWPGVACESNPWLVPRLASTWR